MSSEEKLRSEIKRLFQDGLKLEKVARLPRNYRLQRDVAARFGAAVALLDELLSGCDLDQPVCAIDRALREYYDSQRHKALSTFHYEDRDLDNAAAENAQSTLSVERALALIAAAQAYATDQATKIWLDARSRTWGLMLKNNKAQGAAIKARRCWEAGDYPRASDYHQQTARYAEEAVAYAETNDVEPEFARALRTTALVMRANSLQAASAVFLERAVEDLDLEDAIRGIRTMLDALEAFEEALRANPEWTQPKSALPLIRGRISDTLRRFPRDWKRIYSELGDENLVVNTMRQIDPVALVEVSGSTESTPRRPIRSLLTWIGLPALIAALVWSTADIDQTVVSTRNTELCTTTWPMWAWGAWTDGTGHEGTGSTVNAHPPGAAYENHIRLKSTLANSAYWVFIPTGSKIECDFENPGPGKFCYLQGAPAFACSQP